LMSFLVVVLVVIHDKWNRKRLLIETSINISIAPFLTSKWLIFLALSNQRDVSCVPTFVFDYLLPKYNIFFSTIYYLNISYYEY
jgi:hypothetical protein